MERKDAIIMDITRLAVSQDWLSTARFHEGLALGSSDLLDELARQQAIAVNKMAVQSSPPKPNAAEQDNFVRQCVKNGRMAGVHLDVSA